MNREAGFTLVELLVVVLLLGVVGAVALTGVVRSLDVSAAATRRVEALTDVQRAQERMTRTIRAADPLDAVASTSMTFDVYVSPSERRQITYALAGNRLEQTVLVFTPWESATPTSTSTTAVVDQLDQGATPVFRYFTVHGTPWPDTTTDPAVPLDQLSDIRRVELTLVRAIDDSTIPLSTSVFIRNNQVRAS